MVPVVPRPSLEEITPSVSLALMMTTWEVWEWEARHDSCIYIYIVRAMLRETGALEKLEFDCPLARELGQSELLHSKGYTIQFESY